MKEYIEKSDSMDLEKELSVLQKDILLESGKQLFKMDTIEILRSSGTTLTHNPKINDLNKIKKDAAANIEPPIRYDTNGAVMDPELERYDMTFKNVVQMDGKGSFDLSPIGKYKNCKHIKTGDVDRSNLGQLCKESGPVLTIMDHNSPDKMFGYPRKEFARMLAESDSKYIILGTCNGQNLAEEVLSICYKNKITDKIIYSPTYENKWHGIHPGEDQRSMEYIFGDHFVRSSLGKNSPQDPPNTPDYIINDYSDRPRSLINPVDTYSKRSST